MEEEEEERRTTEGDGEELVERDLGEERKSEGGKEGGNWLERRNENWTVTREN